MHRRILTLLALALALAVLSYAQEHPQHAAPAKTKSAMLMTGLGNWRHPVSTKNAQAQTFFDQGLRLIYAFNHAEAMRSFQHAAELDPELAMAFWGVAEAVGPNYNDPASEDRFAQAHAAIEKAQALAPDISESDKAYIDVPRATRPTLTRLPNAFPPIPNPICMPPRNSIAMPCATWSSASPTISMPPRCSQRPE